MCKTSTFWVLASQSILLDSTIQMTEIKIPFWSRRCVTDKRQGHHISSVGKLGWLFTPNGLSHLYFDYLSIFQCVFHVTRKCLLLQTLILCFFKPFCHQLLQVNPSERLGYGRTGIDDIRAHQFFQGINWNLYKG